MQEGNEAREPAVSEDNTAATGGETAALSVPTSGDGGAEANAEPAGGEAAAGETDYDLYEDDEDDMPNIVLDTERVESGGGGGSTMSFGGGRGRGAVGAGVGRVNLTWNKGGPGGPLGAGGARATGGGRGEGGAGRGFAPGQRNPLEIDMDSLEEKPWRKPGADLSDYFNYGFNEETWRSYCAKQVHVRQEMSMQGKIRVWEGSHKTPDRPSEALPPELLALGALPAGIPPPPVVIMPGDHLPHGIPGMMGMGPKRFGPPGGGRRPPMRGRGDEDSVVQVLSGDGDGQSDSSARPFPFHGGEEPIPTALREPEGMSAMFMPPGMGGPRDFGRGPPFFPPKGNNYRGGMPPFPVGAGGRFPPSATPGGFPPSGGPGRPESADYGRDTRTEDRYSSHGAGYERDRRGGEEAAPDDDRREHLLSPRERERREKEREPDGRDRDWERDRERGDRSARERKREPERGERAPSGGSGSDRASRRYDTEPSASSGSGSSRSSSRTSSSSSGGSSGGHHDRSADRGERGERRRDEASEDASRGGHKRARESSSSRKSSERDTAADDEAARSKRRR